jgi:hypothetical protein
MKKASVLLTVLLLISCLFVGCSDNGNIPHSSFSLADTPIEGEKLFDLSKSGTVTIEFDVPETGYIKLVAYDGTDYIEWPDEIPDIYVDFKTESGKTLYRNISISDGYFRFMTGSNRNETKVVLEGLKLHVSALAGDYSEYITCKEETLLKE